MKWNRSKLIANFKAWAKDADIRDFAGESADDAVSFVKSLAEHYDIPGLVEKGEVNEQAVKDAWGRKTVRIVADAGEEVIVEDGSVDTEAVDEDEEIKAADEEDEVTKAYKNLRKVAQKNGVKDFPGLKGLTGAASSKGVGFRFGDKISAKKLAYERCYKQGIPLRGSKHVPIFDNAEKAEAVGAMLRMATLRDVGYEQKSVDSKIITKTGSTFNPSTGAALVFAEYAPELIELFDQYGIARQAVGIESMKGGEKIVARMDSDVTVYDIGEAGTITASDEGTSPITLTATKTGAMKRLPSELLKDSAISIADIFARSVARAVGKWEDESYILGQHNRTGLGSLVASTGTDRFDSNSGG